MARFAPAWTVVHQVFDRDLALWLAWALGLVSVGGAAASLAPVALKQLVDQLGAGAMAGSSAGWVALYVGGLLLQRSCEQAQVFAYGRLEQGLIRRFSAAAFSHLLRLPLGVHLDGRSGGLAQTLAEGVIGLRLVLTHLVATVWPVIVQLAVAAWVVGRLVGPGAAGAVLIAMVAYAATFAIGVMRLDRPTRALSSSHIAAAGLVTDGLMSVEALKAYGAEGDFARRYDRALIEAEAHGRSFLIRRLENGAAVSMVFGATLAAALATGAADVAAGRLSLGGFVLLNAYVLQIVRPLEMAGYGVRDIGQGLGYLTSLSDLLRLQPEASGTPAQTAQHPTSGAADLRFDEVSYRAGGALVLDRVSFHVQPGRTLAIVGPSGAGKSTLVRLLLRFFEPGAGDIRIDECPIAAMDLDQLRRQIALVAQDTILLNDTLAANIALGRADGSPEAIADAARRACLWDTISGFPQGLDTPAGERGLRLSGGERQRVAIARAALRGARLIVLDEATAALDPSTERAIWKGLASKRGDATFLIITHRLEMIADADEILVLDQGRVVDRGVHPDLVRRGGLYQRLWDAQARPQT